MSNDTPTVFTDEELKQLKKSAMATPDPENQRPRLEALINRLEVAELALTAGHVCHIESQYKCEGCNALRAWYIARGQWHKTDRKH